MVNGMWQPQGILNFFNTLNLKQIFWKTKTLFKNLEYCFLIESTKIENATFPYSIARFLIESTKIENATFPYNIALSEVNVKTNKMVVQNGPITNNGVLPVFVLFFWEFCFS